MVTSSPYSNYSVTQRAANRFCGCAKTVLKHADATSITRNNLMLDRIFGNLSIPPLTDFLFVFILFSAWFLSFSRWSFGSLRVGLGLGSLANVCPPSFALPGSPFVVWWPAGPAGIARTGTL